MLLFSILFHIEYFKGLYIQNIYNDLNILVSFHLNSLYFTSLNHTDWLLYNREYEQ